MARKNGNTERIVLTEKGLAALHEMENQRYVLTEKGLAALNQTSKSLGQTLKSEVAKP